MIVVQPQGWSTNFLTEGENVADNGPMTQFD